MTVGLAEPRQLRNALRPEVSSMSVVVSTYEWPEALDAVLRGLAEQSDRAFEVIVADDGSGPATEATVNRWKRVLGNRLAHVWQPDEGYRLARVRNLGAIAARGQYFVFVDGDCIPRRGFIAAIRRAALPGWYLASSRLQLGRRLSASVLRERLPIGAWSAPMLLVRGRGDIRGWRKLTPRDRRRSWRPSLPDFSPEGNEYGFCMGVARDDFEAVNGFDMRFVGWGDQDVDLAVRLGKAGLRCGYAGPRSTMLHLWHESNEPLDRPTWWLLQETIAGQRTRAVEGVAEFDRVERHE